MNTRHALATTAVLLGLTTFFSAVTAADEGQAPVKLRLTIEPGHRWTPPFGLGRVGRPLEAVVEVPEGAKVADTCVLVEYRDGKEIGRQAVKPMDRFGRVVLDRWPREVVLLRKTDPEAADPAPVELARAKVNPPAFEAEAVARPDQVINPVDLGTVLVPAEWLLLAGGQKADVEVAALSRGGDLHGATVSAWYESAADQKVKADFALSQGRKVQTKLTMGVASTTLTRDTLHVAILDGAGKELWRKDIRVMLVPERPNWPSFGAVATRLRYDLPIAAAGGKTIAYDQGWDRKLQDVVVFLPGGTRFVFWRAACYAPFWAGQYNTGMTYEWAEREPEPWGEPIMDKELRYGRVEIVESTAARVHVRWRYQPCSEQYVVAGDSVAEDYYFYPDGFGTRTLTLTCDQDARYELNEFIVFRPPMAYPLDVLPSNPIDMLWLDGGKDEFQFPCTGARWDEFHNLALKKGKPPIFRVRIHKSEQRTPIQYSPWAIGPTDPYKPYWNTHGGLATDSPERGAIVSPVWSCNWWPLSRGGGTFETSPGTSCLATTNYTAGPNLGNATPRPIRSKMFWTRNTLGQLKPMRRETYAWLIGMTDAGDDPLRQWAQSFAQPPTLEVRGAKLDADSYYAPGRRALCLVVEGGSETVEIAITPAGRCVNPVFELQAAPRTLVSVKLGGQALDRKQYAWDGQTLWLSADLSQPTTLRLTFGAAER